MNKIRVLLVMQDTSLTGAPRLALSTFRDLDQEIELRSVAHLGGPLAGEFRRLGSLTVLTQGLMPRVARRILGSGGSQQAVAALYGRLRSASVVAPGAWRPDVVYVNSAASIPMIRKMS